MPGKVRPVAGNGKVSDCNQVARKLFAALQATENNRKNWIHRIGRNIVQALTQATVAGYLLNSEHGL